VRQARVNKKNDSASRAGRASFIYLANIQRLVVARDVITGSGKNDLSMKTLPGMTARINALKMAIFRSHKSSTNLYREKIPSKPNKTHINLPIQSAFPINLYDKAAI
jgi:hypothetical protein